MDDTLGLILAIALAIPYGLAVALLLKHNSRNPVAWFVAIAALMVWPFAFVWGGGCQLVFVIPVFAVFVLDGYDISRPLSAKTIIVALGSMLLLFGVVFSVAVIDAIWRQ